MSSIALNLTDAIVRNATEGVKRSFIRDVRETGLVLQITPNGHKSFYLHKKYKGESRRILLGEASILSVKRAREEAKKAKALLVKGIDPMDAKRAARAEYTVQQLFDEYMKEKDNLQAKTIEDYYGQWRKHLQPFLGKKKITDVSPEKLKEFHKGLTAFAPYSANRCLSLLKAMYNYAIKMGFFHNINPATLVRKNKEEPHIRCLQQDEMIRFFTVLGKVQNQTIKDVIKILLATGARKRNVFCMRWDELDLDAKIWKISRTKNGEPATLPLTNVVVEILKERLAKRTDNNPWVFPADTNYGHITYVKTTWNRIMKEAQIKNFRVHDLRHTLATKLITDGADVFSVKRALTHKNLQSTQIYVNLGVEDIRETVNFTVDKMFSLSTS